MQDIFQSISTIFSSADDSAREAVMFAAWKRAAGSQLLQHAVPVRFSNGRLRIAVSGIRWKQQMERLGPQMVFRLNGVFGAQVLKYIDFVVDEIAVARSNESRKEQRVLRSVEPLGDELVEASSVIKDPEFRQLFLDAARSCGHRRPH